MTAAGDVSVGCYDRRLVRRLVTTASLDTPITGTASTVCGAGSIVRCPLSVRLSVPAWTNCRKATAAGLLLWARQAGDIDRLQQQRRANAGSATWSAYVVAEPRLVDIATYRLSTPS